VDNLDEVVLQLIELAIRGGGPDNITCIVADVVDSATALLPPSNASVVVGAASNGSGGTHFRTDTPAARAHLLTRTTPQAAVAIAHDDPAPPGQPDEADSSQYRRRRRLPLVKSALVILIVLIVGGAYAAWRYTQGQYYVAAKDGKVVIYRGVNQSVAGISLSSVAQRFDIPVSMLPSMDANGLQATITSPSGLVGARRIVDSIRADYLRCHNAYVALHKWQQTPPKTVKTTVKGKTTTKKVKPPKPTIPADCPAPPASTGNGGA
jgi:PPM family protein phosphatase